MQAKFDGYCRMQKVTDCGGIRQGDAIVHTMEGVNYHSKCSAFENELNEKPVRKGCSHSYEWSNYCGSKVCLSCNDHKGLARCYCGWSKNAGNGYSQLVEMGETIEPDYGYGDDMESLEY